MNKATHKHTHLQAAQSQRTDQSLQKSVLFANAQPTDIKSDREKGQPITIRIKRKPAFSAGLRFNPVLKEASGGIEREIKGDKLPLWGFKDFRISCEGKTS